MIKYKRGYKYQLAKFRNGKRVKPDFITQGRKRQVQMTLPENGFPQCRFRIRLTLSPEILQNFGQLGNPTVINTRSGMVSNQNAERVSKLVLMKKVIIDQKAKSSHI